MQFELFEFTVRDESYCCTVTYKTEDSDGAIRLHGGCVCRILNVLSLFKVFLHENCTNPIERSTMLQYYMLRPGRFNKAFGANNNIQELFQHYLGYELSLTNMFVTAYANVSHKYIKFNKL